MNGTAMEKDDIKPPNNHKVLVYYLVAWSVITMLCVAGIYYDIKFFLIDMTPDSAFIPFNVFALAFGLTGMGYLGLYSLLSLHDTIIEILAKD